jgi:hypothetical protein
MMSRMTIAGVAGLLLSLGGAAFAQATQASPAAGFDARAAKHRGGVFLTREDIRKRSPARLSDLFRGMSGVTLSNNDAGKVILASSRGGRAGLVTSPTSGVTGMAKGVGSGAPLPSTSPPVASTQFCPILVGLDGQMMDSQFSVDDVPVSSVHGIEVYTGSARVPVEFGAGNAAGCGVVMLWSKTGADKP